MNAQEFAFWLQGYLEMSGAKTLGEKEVQILKDHLALVFEKKTPNYDLAEILKRSQQTICSQTSPLVGKEYVVTVDKDVALDLVVPVSC